MGGGAGVQSHRRCALGRGNSAGVEVGVVVIVNADAEFHRDGNIGAGHGFYRRGHNIAEEAAFIGEGGAAATAGDLGDWAAEVHVDVVGQVIVGHHAGRLIRVFRVGCVKLEGAWVFVGAKGCHVARFLVAFDKSTGGNHFAYV